MRMARRTTAVAVLMASALTGCTVGRDYARPETVTATAWRMPTEGAGSLADLDWWQLFEDPVLQSLIRTAIEENKDLRLAVTRVEESRAQLGIARADQLPQIDGRAGYSNQRLSEKSAPLRGQRGPQAFKPENEFHSTGIDLSFELDLWGRLRRGTEAARAELLATEEARRTVLTTLVSDVAQTYFDLIELDREADVARRTRESRRASLDLVQQRFEGGLTSDLDVQRARQELAAAAATVPDLEKRIAQTEHRLSILLGKNPGAIARGATLDAQTPPPAIPAGLPSDLLERRPDIRQAEQRLVAANAKVGQAKADFFPRITLTSTYGLESASLSDLFTGPARAWQFGPTISWPIFHGGRFTSNLRASEAREQQALIGYQQTIQQAFREVEDALVFQQKAAEIRFERQARVAAAERAVEIANLRYTNGLSSYLDVLDAQRQLFSAELELVSSTRDQLTAVVQIYKALGGGWEPQTGKVDR